MKSTVFYGLADVDQKTNFPKVSFGTDYNRARFLDFLRANKGIRIKIEPLTPESNKQRRFFEGAVVPMISFYQEGLDHHKPEDNAKVRDWLKMEFNPEYVVIDGKSTKVPGSTKGKLAKGFLEKVIDWATDQGYKTEFLNPNGYKEWRDTIFPMGGPDNYIDYLVDLKKLP